MNFFNILRDSWVRALTTFLLIWPVGFGYIMNLNLIKDVLLNSDQLISIFSPLTLMARSSKAFKKCPSSEEYWCRFEYVIPMSKIFFFSQPRHETDNRLRMLFFVEDHNDHQKTIDFPLTWQMIWFRRVRVSERASFSFWVMISFVEGEPTHSSEVDRRRRRTNGEQWREKWNVREYWEEEREREREKEERERWRNPTKIRVKFCQIIFF